MRYRLTIAGIVLAAATVLSAQPSYQLHDNGNIWVNDGRPCKDTVCPGWVLLDNHPTTREITAGGLLIGGFPSTAEYPKAPPLYQRRQGGAILYYTGKPCKDGLCPGWRPIGNDPKTVSILASGVELYKRHTDAIWRCKDSPASTIGGKCSVWEQLDNKTNVEIAAAGLLVVTPERHFAGTELYQRRNDGIWRYTSPGWEQIDNHTSTISIVASGDKFFKLYQLRDDGAILGYTGLPCGSDGSCWKLLDKNPHTRQIAVGPASVYKRHDNGAIWRYTGPPPPCSDGSCWQLLDNPPMRTIFTSRN